MSLSLASTRRLKQAIHLSLDLPWRIGFGLNRTFELMLVTMIGYCTLRIIRIRNPRLHRRLWGVAPLAPMRDVRKRRPLARFLRRMREEFSTVEDDDDEFLDPILDRLKSNRRSRESERPDGKDETSTEG